MPARLPWSIKHRRQLCITNRHLCVITMVRRLESITKSRVIIIAMTKGGVGMVTSIINIAITTTDNQKAWLKKAAYAAFFLSVTIKSNLWSILTH